MIRDPRRRAVRRQNLFDVAGLVTLAGSGIDREAIGDGGCGNRRRMSRPGDPRRRLMDDAYKATTENPVWARAQSATRRIAGGCRRSGAAVVGGLVPLALGSDTNARSGCRPRCAAFWG